MSELKITKTEEGKISWYHKLYIKDQLINNEFNSYQDPRIRLALMDIPDVKGKRVLDLGCASGGVSFEMARRGAKCFGIDYDLDTIKALNCLAKTYGYENLKFFRLDISGEEFRVWLIHNKPFDVVFALRIIGWINGVDLKETFAMRKRVLSAISLVTPIIFYESINSENHDKLLDTLRGYGLFKTIQTVYRDFHDKSDTPSPSDKYYCLFKCETTQ